MKIFLKNISILSMPLIVVLISVFLEKGFEGVYVATMCSAFWCGFAYIFIKSEVVDTNELLKKEINVAESDCRALNAIAAGYQQFGNVPFLVKQVVQLETPHNFISNRLGV